MATEIIKVPDLGGSDSVEVIELCVAVGDVLEAEQSIVVLETDKASMEIPTPKAGKVLAIKVGEGDSVNEGDALLELEIASADSVGEVPTEELQIEAPVEHVEPAVVVNEPQVTGESKEYVELVPDLGGSDGVEVIEVCVAVGDDINEGDSLVVLETDKASMEIPTSQAGKVLELKLNVGDKVSVGDAMALLSVSAPVEAAAGKPAIAAVESPQTKQVSPPVIVAPPSQVSVEKSDSSDAGVYAGPSVRKLARQLGVDLSQVKSSGPRSRYTKDDVRNYVKQMVKDVKSGGLSSGSGIPPIPAVDFSKFGDIELQKMSKIKKVTVANMTRSWLNVPHVTQFDEADISDLEAFRKSMKPEAERRGVKLTPLPFLLKAAASALQAEPSFNVSLHSDGEHIVQKNYIHIGIAVDTPVGLLVPVIRDVDKKGLWELAAETAEMAKKAREGKLLPRDMQGGCFTISSLGAIGGTGFTPIVNAPEVAIMGVSKAQIKPVWNGSEFEPKQMLPLSVSYDHRAVNGVNGGRFFTHLVSVLSDIRRLCL